ncbi:MAG: hypothetical protein ACXAAH_00220 [Promethearchaeota archaeon]|jgi:hypothetical protein
MLGWIILGVLFYFFVLCPFIGWVYSRLMGWYSGIENIGDWLFGTGSGPIHMFMGVGITLLLGTIIFAVGCIIYGVDISDISDILRCVN